MRVDEIPHVDAADRFSIDCLDLGFWRRFGFMDDPNVPKALAGISGSEFDPEKASFFLGKETIRYHRRRGLLRWREALFAWMSHSARDATSFFSLPPNRVVELGSQVEV